MKELGYNWIKMQIWLGNGKEMEGNEANWSEMQVRVGKETRVKERRLHGKDFY